MKAQSTNNLCIHVKLSYIQIDIVYLVNVSKVFIFFSRDSFNSNYYYYKNRKKKTCKVLGTSISQQCYNTTTQQQ